MILSAPARHVGIPDELTLPSKLLSVETSRRNQTLKYAWDRDLADLSDAEVLELAPYRVHIKYVLDTFPEFTIDVLKYLDALNHEFYIALDSISY